MSEIRVLSVKDDAAEIEKWNEFVAAHSEATLYHHLAWRRIFEQSFGYKSWMLMACDEGGGGQTVGVLPLYLVNGLFSSKLVSVPFRDRGGPLWITGDALEALLTSAKLLIKEAGAKLLVMKSLSRWPVDTLRNHTLLENMHWVRSVVPINSLSVETLWKNIGAKTRNMIRQAEANGLAFEDITNSPDALDQWYRLHLGTQKRLGIPPFPKVYFLSLIRELMMIGAVSVYCVKKENLALAAMILFRDGRTGIYAYSASSVDAQKLRANDLLIFRTIRELISAGYWNFDMGSDSPHQDSLLFFKRKWGAKQLAIPHYSYGSFDPASADSASSRYKLARRFFSWLPLPLSALFSRYGTRYFG